jgi:hypothetical protein
LALQLKFSPELKAMLEVRPPQRVKILLIKERGLKRIIELSQKSLRQIPPLEEPTEYDKRWIEFRMSHSNTWPVRENKIGDWKHWK